MRWGRMRGGRVRSVGKPWTPKRPFPRGRRSSFFPPAPIDTRSASSGVPLAGAVPWSAEKPVRFPEPSAGRSTTRSLAVVGGLLSAHPCARCRETVWTPTPPTRPSSYYTVVGERHFGDGTGMYDVEAQPAKEFCSEECVHAWDVVEAFKDQAQREAMSPPRRPVNISFAASAKHFTDALLDIGEKMGQFCKTLIDDLPDAAVYLGRAFSKAQMGQGHGGDVDRVRGHGAVRSLLPPDQEGGEGAGVSGRARAPPA